jgi:hypothetical protein
MINFINKIGNQDLCKSIIDNEEDMALLLTCMSRSRKTQFTDDLKYLHQQYASSLLTPEEIIEVKLRINDMLVKELSNLRGNAG